MNRAQEVSLFIFLILPITPLVSLLFIDAEESDVPLKQIQSLREAVCPSLIIMLHYNQPILSLIFSLRKQIQNLITN